MKRYLIIALIAILSTPIIGQVKYIAGETTLSYSLPKTVIIVDIVTEKITQKPGKFYQYSQRYLATNRVITEQNTAYAIRKISIRTDVVPDENRTFSIEPKKRSLATLIATDQNGILCGINIAPKVAPTPVNSVIIENREPQTTEILPLNEDYMLAGSVAKMAEGAAKQIYKIRENRIDLLSGYTESVPKDGAAVKAMISEMAAQEKQLTELFIGTTTSTSQTQTIIYTPRTGEKDAVLFRFSTSRGVVDNDDLSGNPYFVTIDYKKILESANDKKRKDKDIKVFSVVPVVANVTINDGDKNLLQTKITLPQLGILQPIPFDEMDKHSKAYVSTETGRLTSITKER